MGLSHCEPMAFKIMEFLRCLSEGHWMNDTHKAGRLACVKCGYQRKV